MAEPPYILCQQTSWPFAKSVLDAFCEAWQAQQPYPLVMLNHFSPTKMPLHDPACVAWLGFLASANELAAVDSQVPVINFSNRHGPLPGCHNVLLDDVGIGAMAAEHLLAKGFRELIFIGHPEHVYGTDRAEGFRRSVEASGNHARILYWEEFNPARSPLRAREEARAWVAEVLQQLNGPTGILAANDNIASYLLKLARELQPEVLPWLGVVGVDNSVVAHGTDLHGPFTSIEPPLQAMGQTLVRVLADAIANGIKKTSVISVGGARVMERATTGAPVSNDLFVARISRRIHDAIEHGECPSVDALASAFGVTPRALLARFNRKTSQSLRDYILHARLRRAATLLTDTTMTIAAIAYASGFSKHAALTEHFGKAYGMTPSAYRNQHEHSRKK